MVNFNIILYSIYIAVATEGCGVGPEVWGYGVRYIWKRGVLTSGRGNTVQVSGKTSGPIRQRLAEDSPEHQEVAEVLGADGKDTVMGGGRYPCVGNILLGGGASGSVLWIGIVSHVRGDDKDGGGNPYKLPKAYHG